ncbi:MAG TPA: SDR family oxidoreductase [Armatimonadota bacterium]|nr:SDR family oxidoreductase [Armatimonadota bacterium]
MKPLEGKVALVTGASRGIGRGCAVELARGGARVVVNYRSHPEEAEAVARECREAGGEAMTFGADVADHPAVDRMFAAARERFGAIDILVNNAYRSIRKPFLELTPQDLRDTWEVSLLAPFYCSRLAAAEMVRRGRGGKIVMVSSVLAFIPLPNSLPYNSAKAGMEQMACTMATELAPHRINVNVVEPGWTDTPGERAFLSEEELQEEARKLPWGRMANIREMGEVVAFLCSPAADYITGATLRVDGGYWLPRAPAPVNRD